MKGRGQKSGGASRVVTQEEAELWQHATRSLDRVKAKPRVVPEGEASAAPAPHPPLEPAPRERAPPPAAKASAPANPRSARPPAPLAEFERRKARQIASGKTEVDARIDLHGLRQSDAHARLRAFLVAARDKGHRTVLVITGKGSGDESGDRLGSLMGERQRGVLRRSVPAWLEQPDLRAIVLSYTQAGVRHGGAWALYVQLRKGAR